MLAVLQIGGERKRLGSSHRCATAPACGSMWGSSPDGEGTPQGDPNAQRRRSNGVGSERPGNTKAHVVQTDRATLCGRHPRQNLGEGLSGTVVGEKRKWRVEGARRVMARKNDAPFLSMASSSVISKAENIASALRLVRKAGETNSLLPSPRLRRGFGGRYPMPSVAVRSLARNRRSLGSAACRNIGPRLPGNAGLPVRPFRGQSLHCLANLARIAFGFRRLPCTVAATPARAFPA